MNYRSEFISISKNIENIKDFSEIKKNILRLEQIINDDEVHRNIYLYIEFLDKYIYPFLIYTLKYNYLDKDLNKSLENIKNMTTIYV